MLILGGFIFTSFICNGFCFAKQKHYTQSISNLYNISHIFLISKIFAFDFFVSYSIIISPDFPILLLWFFMPLIYWRNQVICPVDCPMCWICHAFWIWLIIPLWWCLTWSYIPSNLCQLRAWFNLGSAFNFLSTLWTSCCISSWDIYYYVFLFRDAKIDSGFCC